MWVYSRNSALSKLQFKHEQEAAALFIYISWLASSENQQMVITDWSTLDMEILNVYVHSCQPLPLIIILNGFIMSHANLEAVVLEIDLCEYSKRLILIILYIKLVCYNVILWECSRFEPAIILQIIGVAFFLLISTKE